MNTTHFLELLDRFRKESWRSGFRREARPGLVRHVSISGTESAVAFSAHDSATLQSAIADEIAYFASLGHSFEWKVYSHDKPDTLEAALQASGFEPGEQEALLVLDLCNCPGTLLKPVTHAVHRITSPSEVGLFATISEQVWGCSDFDRELATTLERDPNSIGLYVAMVDGKPVSSARLSIHPDFKMAGLWGGTTLPVFRKQGLYTDLLRIRVQEAIRRGLQYVTVDALPTSRPILEKHGFQFVAFTRPFVWLQPCGTQSLSVNSAARKADE